MAVSILSLVMIAVVSLAITSLNANRSNIYRLTAYYLAQEGLEGLRNVRDTNWMQNITWNEGMDSLGEAAYWGHFFDADGFYTIDYVPWADASEATSMPWSISFLGTDPSVAEGESGRLFVATGLTSSEVYYVHDVTETTQFTYETSPYRRILTLTYSDSGDDWFEVTAQVFWIERGQERSVEVSTILSDWREGPL